MSIGIEILDLGFLDYDTAWAFQKEKVEQRLVGAVHDTILLVEHPAVITLGRRKCAEDVLVRKFPVFEIERGGRATYHGPGQLVCYPIVDVMVRGGVKKFVWLLEEVILNTLKTFHMEGSRQVSNTGVWVGDYKIASIGIAVKKRISYHGLALNVSTNLSHYEVIRPCGFTSDAMTSMEKILGKTVLLEDVKKTMKRDLRQWLG